MKVQWKEPVQFKLAYARAMGGEPSRRRLVIAGLIAAAVVAGLTAGFEWFFHALHNKDLGVPAYFYVVAPTLAGLFIGFFPRMLASIPATIVLDDKGAHRNMPVGSEMSIQFWPWQSIEGMAIEDVTYSGVTFRVLVVRCPDSPAEVMFGLGDVRIDSIEEIARARTARGLEIKV